MAWICAPRLSSPTPLIINKYPTCDKCWTFSHLEFPLITETDIFSCREEIVQHSNLKVRWNLRKSGWNLGVAGKDPAQQGEVFPPCHEEEQQKSIWGLLSIYSSIKDVSSGIPSCSNTSTLLEWGYLKIYIFKRKNQALYFLWKTRCGEDRSDQDPIFPDLNSKCLLFWYESLTEKLAQVPLWLSEPPLGTAQIKCPSTSDKLWNAGNQHEQEAATKGWTLPNGPFSAT